MSCAREHIPRQPLWPPPSSWSLSVWLRATFGTVASRRYLALPLPGAEHLVRADHRVSRWHAPSRSYGYSRCPFCPVSHLGRANVRGKKGTRVEAVLRLAKNRNEARPEGRAMHRRRRRLPESSSSSSWLWLCSFSNVTARTKQKLPTNKSSRGSGKNERERELEEELMEERGGV